MLRWDLYEIWFDMQKALLKEDISSADKLHFGKIS